jgi:CHASE3 domain sensor protein
MIKNYFLNMAGVALVFSTFSFYAAAQSNHSHKQNGATLERVADVDGADTQEQ